MSCIGNVIWFIFGGLFGWIGWMVAGILWSITIIGLPIGLQCFKIATMSLAPFGKEVVYEHTNTSFLLNILWIILSGFWLAVGHLISAVFLCITIIGIPFAGQSLKLAQVSFMPFGARIERLR
ncbi:YccF domain-containing protein [Enterococcus italicus]|uniref:YccF domain-containing protein n=1 Tax=Enterococcus italicus TaxID=246144 RepID=UPI003F44B1A3